ncbi:MAG: ATP-binding protein, partial [Alphaproteobacteria bacterium]|nr:ATP-binding protein [Alphaproteobacteria bacterium]
EESDRQWILHSGNLRQGMQFSFLPQYDFPIPENKIINPQIIRPLLVGLTDMPYRLEENPHNRSVTIYIQVENPRGVLKTNVSYKRFYTTSIVVFMLVNIIVTAVLLLVAGLFLKNQIRPIQQLGKVAKDSGNGKDTSYYRPKGAAEVRHAGLAFIAMRDRIFRQIDERTRMLAGVSHDLRTPLTRMKLALAITKDKQLKEELGSDILDMQRMIDSYLEFARQGTSEQPQEIDLAQLCRAVAEKLKVDKPVTVIQADEVVASLPLNNFKRMLSNIVENAVKYADRAEITIAKHGKHGIITIDDDGPGIPYEKRDEVFKAFYRLEDSRNQNTGGLGLGLAVTKDIAMALGLDMRLDQSPLGGLRVEVKVPL